MNWQMLIVAVIVPACFVYALWAMMPDPTRRSVARVLRRVPLLARIRALTGAAEGAASGCACDGCDRGKAAVRPATGRDAIVHWRTHRPDRPVH